MTAGQRWDPIEEHLILVKEELRGRPTDPPLPPFSTSAVPVPFSESQLCPLQEELGDFRKKDGFKGSLEEALEKVKPRVGHRWRSLDPYKGNRQAEELPGAPVH